MGLVSGALAKLRSGLTRTRDAFAGRLRSVLMGRTLDEALIRELEATLIGSDVGVQTTTRLIAKVREGYKAGTLTRGDDVLEVLTSVDKVGGASAVMAQRILRDGVVLSEASIRVACMDSSGRPARFPDAMRRSLKALD